MPRDFRSFANENKNIIDEQKEEANKYENIINKYKNMDQQDLLSNLFNEANKLKQEGKLDSNTLSNLETTLAPFLNNEQQVMLKNLISAINGQK